VEDIDRLKIKEELLNKQILWLSCVYLGTHWHVAKTTKYGDFFFDLVKTKFPKLMFFSEGKNSIFAYYPSWFRLFLPPSTSFLAPEYISSGGQEEVWIL